MIGDGEPVNILQSANRKARKQHACEECNRKIQIGETYRYEFGICDGYSMTYHTCVHCMTARAWLTINCDGFVYCTVQEDIHEHAIEYPALAEPLRALANAMRAKWMSNGELMPVMAVPPPIEIAA